MIKNHNLYEKFCKKYIMKNVFKNIKKYKNYFFFYKLNLFINLKKRSLQQRK